MPQALIAAGMCERRTLSGIALRGWREERRDAAGRPRSTSSGIASCARLRMDLPCRDGVFNIGVGIAHNHRTLEERAPGHGT